MAKRTKIRKVLVMTSGGDAPGMNAAIRAVVRACHFREVEVYAGYHGYRGLVNGEVKLMPVQGVANAVHRGGTILKSSRCKEFHDPKVRAEVIKFLKKKKINSLIVIGGDGSFRAASLLRKEGGLQVIGIPATIDNDILGTEYTIGFDTARNTALRAIDQIRDTAMSNERYFLVEVMGRRAGFLAASIGIGGGAEFVVVPEFPLSNVQLAQKLLEPRRRKKSLIIVVAEAGIPGRSVAIAEELRQLTPFDYRVCILGHTQRGGSPSAMDREIASQMGAMAVDRLLAGSNNRMTAMRDGKLVLAPFPGPKKPSRTLEDMELLELSHILSV